MQIFLEPVETHPKAPFRGQGAPFAGAAGAAVGFWGGHVPFFRILILVRSFCVRKAKRQGSVHMDFGLVGLARILWGW